MIMYRPLISERKIRYLGHKVVKADGGWSSKWTEVLLAVPTQKIFMLEEGT
jgi:hypothetical protein